MPGSGHDVVVLGAGPAGLAAALALVRDGARVCVVDAAAQVGGLCVTRRAGGFGYDVGGHALFVRTDDRLAWLRELLGEGLHWVDRPVSSVHDGRIEPGRYLDRAAGDAAVVDGVHAGPTEGGVDYLRAVGADPEVARAYLEKIDGLALEDIAGARVERLLVGQRAPEGFWYPAGGIGALMDAMAGALRQAGGTVLLGAPVAAIDTAGGRTRGVVARVDGRLDHPLPADSVVVAMPPRVAAELAVPGPPRGAVPARMRAVAIAYLALGRPRLTQEPWIQVADPRVPFARIFEPGNWSPALSPEGVTLVGCECYCQASPQDPIWSLTDEAIGAACASALDGPFGGGGGARVVEVVRIAGAYPSVPVAELPSTRAPIEWLGAIAGIEIAQGGAAVEAIDAGEHAARRILAG